MTRRIIRSLGQLAVIGTVVFILVLFLDNRFSVLPTSIHNHLPAHHPGLAVTDITVQTCSTLNPLSKCKLNGDEWHRIEKDLLLDTGFFQRAYVHIKRKREEELKHDDRVIIDIKVSKMDPSVGQKNHGNERWEWRTGGLWIQRSAKRHESDSKKAITAVDVLFGSDAVEPRPGWKLLDGPLLLDHQKSGMEAVLSVRLGPMHKVERPKPRIRKDGRFKILQAADLHLSTGLGHCRDPEPPHHNGGRCDADPRTLEFIARVLDEEEPDMVVLTGDQVNGDTAPDVESAIFKFAELFVKRRIPYAVIFGNHDDEGPMHRGAMMSLIETLPYSVAERGPSTIDGIGNYVVEVLAPGTSHHSAVSLYFFDTHGMSPDEKQFKGYDWVKDSQIRWFKETSKTLKKKHASYTKIHMSLAFIHIPLPEYGAKNEDLVGEWLEGVSAPAYNSRLRDVLVDEGVLAVSCGHDHVNDFCALSKSAGPSFRKELWMCYGGGAGFGGYGGYGGYHRRVRIFDIDTNSARITTYKKLEYGDTKRKLDEQTIVESGKVVGS